MIGMKATKLWYLHTNYNKCFTIKNKLRLVVQGFYHVQFYISRLQIWVQILSCPCILNISSVYIKYHFMIFESIIE